MTLADRENISNKEKGDDIYFMLETITGGFKDSFVQDIFRKGGYSEEFPLTTKEKPTILNQAFHPESQHYHGRLTEKTASKFLV